jgi:hypothetical protein
MNSPGIFQRGQTHNTAVDNGVGDHYFGELCGLNSLAGLPRIIPA